MINGRSMVRQRQLEEEDNIIVKWTQEDVETFYNLLINKKILILVFYVVFLSKFSIYMSRGMTYL